MWKISTSNLTARQFYKQATQNFADLGKLKFSLRWICQELFFQRTAAYIHSHTHTVSLTLQKIEYETRGGVVMGPNMLKMKCIKH